MFPCFPEGRTEGRSCAWDNGDWPSVEWIREQHDAGRIALLGELLNVYAGVSFDDPRMRPYWSLAAELDLPVFVHINRGPPPDSLSRPTGCCPDFDADLGNPALLRPILRRYPGLRVVLQHAGFPAMPMFDGIEYLDETYAMLDEFENVYVDLTIINSLMPPAMHEQAVRDLKARGFVDRILFGTDNVEAQPSIDRVRNMTFLTESERRDILYDNARRFFRLE